MNRWMLIRDVLVTGTGLAVIVSQVFSPRPNDALLVTAMAMIAPSIADHARALLSGPGGGESSSRDQPEPGRPSE